MGDTMKILTIAGKYEARIIADKPLVLKYQIYDRQINKVISSATINSDKSSVWEIEPEAEELHNCDSSKTSEYNFVVRMCHVHALDKFEPLAKQ